MAKVKNFHLHARVRCIDIQNSNKFSIDQKIDQEVKKVIPILKNHLDSTQTAAVELILGKILKEKKLSISTAESCTGGYIAGTIGK